jgi:hypothetical protein
MVHLTKPDRYGKAALAATQESGMGRVTGIGGIALRGQNPEALFALCDRHLGIPPVQRDHDVPIWERGPTGFSAVPKHRRCFCAPGQSPMIDLAASGRDGLAAELRANGMNVYLRHGPNRLAGVAHLYDPEGNRNEPWEPV